jgi:hypothetical protein
MSAKAQVLAHKGVVLVGRTKGSEMNYEPERLSPKFRHPFALLMRVHRADDSHAVTKS